MSTFLTLLVPNIRHLRDNVPRSKLESIPQIAISRIHPLFDCLVILWKWRDVAQIWWTISAPRPGLGCAAPSQFLIQCIGLRCNLVQLCLQLLHLRDFVPWTPAGVRCSEASAIPQLLLQPDPFVLCFPQHFLGSGQPVPRFLEDVHRQGPRSSCCAFLRASRNILASGLLSSPNASTAVCKRTTRS